MYCIHVENAGNLENFRQTKDRRHVRQLMVSLSAVRIQIVLSIIGWYASGAVLVSANKVMFGILRLNIPLLVTFIHFSITSLLMVLVKKNFPNALGETQVTISEFFRTVLPVAVCTAGDVGLSNMAYSRLPISVMTILKSSAPVCIYFAAVLAGLERFQWRIVSICLVITTSVGFALPSNSGSEDAEVEYAYFSGVVIVLLAVICLSVRWVFIQSLSRQYTPFQLIYLIQPTSALVLLPLVLVFDSGHVESVSTDDNLLLGVCLIIGSGFAALLLLFCEYQIVHHTTSLTLSVGGIGKEILTLLLSFIVFRESFTARQIAAISVSLVAIFAYAYTRTTQEAAEGYVKTGGSASSVVILAGLEEEGPNL